MRDGLILVALVIGLPIAHWYLVESWLLWALTLPVVCAVSVFYILFKGGQEGPGRH